MSENATVEQSSFWEFKGEIDYVDKWFLMSTPIPIFAIWMVYLAFVLKIGPGLMKKRPPYDLNNVLILYNVIQIVVSCFLFSLGIHLLIQNGLILQKQCLSEREDLKKITAVAIYYYFSAKLSELLDTVFFVLRKKDRQVTFLHVYHHSVTVLASWFALKYEPSYSTVFLGTINSFVHIVMYTYYGLSAFPDLTKYLWWKKYITSMQLIQFVIIIFQVVVNYKASSCRPSYGLLTVMLWNIMLFVVLFADFYFKTYSKRNAEISTGKECNGKITDVANNGTYLGQNKLNTNYKSNELKTKSN